MAEPSVSSQSSDQGFMALFPLSDDIKDGLESFEVEAGPEAVAFLETTRGRALGSHPVFIADVPWPYLTMFRKCTSRLPAGVVAFSVEGVAARPQLASALAVADQWVSEVLDAETANEYLSAMEMEDAESGAEEPSLPTAPNLRGAVPKNSEVEALHLRLAQLESLLQQQGQGPEVSPSVPAQPQRLLFNAAPTGDLTQAEWDTIKQKLGAAPKRLGKPERKTIPTQQAEREMLIDEVEKEVLDPDALGTLAQLNLGGVTDPLQKLLILQVLQTSDIVKSLAPKSQQDPLSAILGGSDNAAASSRKQFSQRQRLCSSRSVHQDLGGRPEDLRDHSSQCSPRTWSDPSKRRTIALEDLLRTEGSDWRSSFVGSTRFPGSVGMGARWHAVEHPTASFLRSFDDVRGTSGIGWWQDSSGLAHDWAGRTQFPTMSINRRRSSLTPFGRLPAPTWVAANVSYLKDVDTFETRLRQIGLPKSFPPANPPAEDEEKVPRPKRVPKKPKWGKGADAPSDTPNN